MRQVLPTKPLARARRYGPFLAGHWKYLVLASQGLKQDGFSPGPLTTFGPAARTAEDARKAAIAATVPVRALMLLLLEWKDTTAYPAMDQNCTGAHQNAACQGAARDLPLPCQSSWHGRMHAVTHRAPARPRARRRCGPAGARSGRARRGTAARGCAAAPCPPHASSSVPLPRPRA